MSNPDEIRRDIERTRTDLSDNVNALSDSTHPGNIARSQVDKAKSRARGLRERVFGSDDDYDDRTFFAGDQGHVSGSKVDDARQNVAEAPARLKRTARGNPIAAGLVALGVGALIGGLLPASRVEEDAAADLRDRAEPLTDEVKQMATEAKEHLQPAAQEAADSVKETAQQAGEQVKSDATQAKDDVTDQARSSAENVRAEAKDAQQG